MQQVIKVQLVYKVLLEKVERLDQQDLKEPQVIKVQLVYKVLLVKQEDKVIKVQ